MRERIFHWLTLQVYFPFCYLVYKGKKSQVCETELEQMPAGSLGREVHSFIRKENLNLIKGYELHDIKHVLLGYRANFRDEVCMQYFELGNGNRSLPVFVVVFFGSLLLPEHFIRYIAAFRRGRQAESINNSDLELRLINNIQELRIELKLT